MDRSSPIFEKTNLPTDHYTLKCSRPFATDSLETKMQYRIPHSEPSRGKQIR